MKMSPARVRTFAKRMADTKVTVFQIQTANVLTMTYPKNVFLKAETTKRYGDRDSQYGDNRSWRFKIHRGNKNQNDEEGKKT